MTPRAQVESAIKWMYRTFFVTKVGQIFGLTAKGEHPRDALALARMGRLFPIPEYEGVRVEPGRLMPVAENIIIVGQGCLYRESDPKWFTAASVSTPFTGPPPETVSTLSKRLEELEAGCCFVFSAASAGPRRIVNRVTRRGYTPEGPDQDGREVDFAVIRRRFRGFENTITLEGVHRVGTLAAAKVATSLSCLETIQSAVGRLTEFDESAPLEVLVRGTFLPQLTHGVHTLDAIEATPLLVVYNQRWIFDLQDDRDWEDQRPWGVIRLIQGAAPAATNTASGKTEPLPRLEVRADLEDLDPETRALCKKLLRVDRGDATKTPPDKQAVRAVLHALLSRAGAFAIDLIDAAPVGRGRPIHLPQGEGHLRQLRKRFLLHLVFGALLNEPFRCEEDYIREFYPDFKSEAATRSLVRAFVGHVNGRLREGFGVLLGEKKRPKDYMHVHCDRVRRMYQLALKQLTVVVKLRFGDEEEEEEEAPKASGGEPAPPSGPRSGTPPASARTSSPRRPRERATAVMQPAAAPDANPRDRHGAPPP